MSQEPWAFCQVWDFTINIFWFFNGVNDSSLPSLLYGMSMSSMKPQFKWNRGPTFTIYSHENWAKSYSFLPLWNTLYTIINSFKSSQFAELLKPLSSVEAVNNQHCGILYRLTKKREKCVNDVLYLMFLPACTIFRWDSQRLFTTKTGWQKSGSALPWLFVN